MLRVLDLFSGIGGFSLGLERTGGFKTVAFCEIEKFPQQVLRKHWPEVPIYDDVRTLTATRLAADGIEVDVICGGFPCQDISIAGAGAGLAGERSGLWNEYARIIGELRPRYVIVENVAALLHRGLGDVLGDMAAIGYDAEWHCIPASAVGAPHRRDRIWIVASDAGYRNESERSRDSWRQDRERTPIRREPSCDGKTRIVADADCGQVYRQCADTRDGRTIPQKEPQRIVCRGDGSDDVADANGQRLEGWLLDWFRAGQRSFRKESRSVPGGWISEPDVGRVANGIPRRVDRLKSLGNAVVPQIPELIGRAILSLEATDPA